MPSLKSAAGGEEPEGKTSRRVKRGKIKKGSQRGQGKEKNTSRFIGKMNLRELVDRSVSRGTLDWGGPAGKGKRKRNKILCGFLVLRQGGGMRKDCISLDVGNKVLRTTSTKGPVKGTAEHGGPDERKKCRAGEGTEPWKT